MTTTILHIEDDPKLARATKRWLERLLPDVDVTSALNAKEAIALLPGRKWDLVLSDYDLGPGPTGGDVLDVVQSQHPELAARFVFLSASAEARRRAIALGVGRYLDKPPEYADFAAVIRGVLGTSEISDNEKLTRCAGCVDDFYNGKNPMSIKRCWSFKTAEPVIRWRISTWTQPTARGAFTEVATLSCHRGQGYHHSTKLPDFAIDPIRLRVVQGDES